MMKRDYVEPRAKSESALIWADLGVVCQRVHHHLYEICNKTAAKRYRRRLERITHELPENDLAILKEEALALLYELADDITLAIQHRSREIELIERLRASVQNSIEAGQYDEKMGSSILANWDAPALKQRRAILRGLQAREQNAI